MDSVFFPSFVCFTNPPKALRRMLVPLYTAAKQSVYVVAFNVTAAADDLIAQLDFWTHLLGLPLSMIAATKGIERLREATGDALLPSSIL